MSSHHVVAHDGTQRPFGFECLHCGATRTITLPISFDKFVAASKEFVAQHRACPARTCGGTPCTCPTPGITTAADVAGGGA